MAIYFGDDIGEKKNAGAGGVFTGQVDDMMSQTVRNEFGAKPTFMNPTPGGNIMGSYGNLPGLSEDIGEAWKEAIGNSGVTEEPIEQTQGMVPVYQPSDEPDKGMLGYIKSLYGDPEEDAKKQRANEARMGILALGDAMRNIGNIYHTTRYAPSQKFNEPVKDEYERQEKEDLLLKTQREKAAKMLQDYEKQQADLAYKNEDLRLKRDKNAREAEEQGWKKEKYAADAEQTRARTGQIEAQTEELGKESARKDRKLEADIIHQQNQDKVAAENAETSRQRVAVAWANHRENIRHHKATERKISSARSRGGGTVSAGKLKIHVMASGQSYGFLTEPTSLQISTLYDDICRWMPRTSHKGLKTNAQMWKEINRYSNDDRVKERFLDWGGALLEDVSDDFDVRED